MEPITVFIGDQAVRLEGELGESLLSVLQRGKINLSAPCGGAHTCGKCLLQVQGSVSAIESGEAALLASHGSGTRLACCAKVTGPCTLYLKSSEEMEVLTGHTAHSAGNLPLFTGTYGAAVDIGTTTLAAYLYDSSGKAPLAVVGSTNCQGQYGADVITRIAYDSGDPHHTLTRLIREQIADLFHSLLEKVGARTEDLSAAVITGNTTMLHLLSGLDTRSLAQAPFTPASLFGGWCDCSIPGFSHIQCYLPPCISAYVGADITCGLLSSKLLDQPGNILLVDVGTNGEMVLKTGNHLVCCSTAAGPAFEGSGISRGSGAVPGAISHIWAHNGQACCETIGGKSAVSLCGSGLIDALAVYLSLGYISPEGRIIAPQSKDSIQLADTGVYLTQKDIRQAQLAKGAIRAGIDTLLYSCGLEYHALDSIFLCGGFGFHMRPLAAERIGMIPPACGDKTVALGNSAGAGAAAILLDQSQTEQAQNISTYAECIDLSTNRFFVDDFMKQIRFPEKLP